MGLLSRKRSAPQASAPQDKSPRAVLAAAMPLAGPGVRAMERNRKQSTAEAWQGDAWYFFDVVGEFRGPVQWIANAVSQADLYAAEVDQETGLVTGPTEDARAQAAAALAFGGQGHRAQLQELLAIHWQVPGESYIVIRPRPDRDGVPQPDEWLVLSGDEIKPSGGRWEYTDPRTVLPVTLGARDVLIRVWKPHPRKQSFADSAARPALIPLREIEKASQNLSARLDSRLAGNGLLFLPSEMDFPQGDAETQAQAIMLYIMEAMEASIAAPGQSSAHVPIVVQIPGSMIGQVQHLDLATAMDEMVTALRQDALSRLAATLDMPKPVAEGTQNDSNHWGAWQVSEDTYQVFIRPLLDRMGDAITEHWYRPTLRAMGVPDPEKYVLAWDTSSIVQRPGETEDLDHLYDLGLISADYRLQASGIPEDAKPDDAELHMRNMRAVLESAPSVAVANQELSQALFGIDAVEDPDADGAVAAPGAAPAIEPPAAPERAEPDTQDDVPDGLVAAAELLVFDALGRAGGRMLSREHRGKYGNVPKHELHTVIACADTGAAMAGSFQFADRVADAYGVSPGLLALCLTDYVATLLRDGTAHDPARLRERLGLVLTGAHR